MLPLFFSAKNFDLTGTTLDFMRLNERQHLWRQPCHLPTTEAVGFLARDL